MDNLKRKAQLDWTYCVTFTTQLTEADHARMMRQAGALGLNRSQFTTLALITMLDAIDKADAKNAGAEAAQGAGHPSYTGPNGDGE